MRLVAPGWCLVKEDLFPHKHVDLSCLRNRWILDFKKTLCIVTTRITAHAMMQSASAWRKPNTKAATCLAAAGEKPTKRTKRLRVTRQDGFTTPLPRAPSSREKEGSGTTMQPDSMARLLFVVRLICENEDNSDGERT